MYKLLEAAKPAFARPWAPVLSGDEAVRRVRGKYLISVGDVVTETFLKAGIEPHVSIVDGKTRRHEALVEDARLLATDRGLLCFPVENPAGTITDALWQGVTSALSSGRSSAIVVEGEEDLAAIPAVLLGPEGAIVAYGQPPVTSLGVHEGGVVLIEITPESRAQVKELLSKMEVV